MESKNIYETYIVKLKLDSNITYLPSQETNVLVLLKEAVFMPKSSKAGQSQESHGANPYFHFSSLKDSKSFPELENS